MWGSLRDTKIFGKHYMDDFEEIKNMKIYLK